MHDSKMIADVVPPSDCAIENVSGRSIATPFAPPKPGRTPMITPRITPANISRIFFKVRAIAKPCINELISSMPVNSQFRPSAASSGPFGSGIRNHISKTRKKNTLLPKLTKTTFHQAYFPSQRMKNAMNTVEAT